MAVVMYVIPQKMVVEDATLLRGHGSVDVALRSIVNEVKRLQYRISNPR
jgi:hypothetical protein